jgi:hypothetical protein
MVQKRRQVAEVYQTHTETDQAVTELLRDDFDIYKGSIVGKADHTDEQIADSRGRTKYREQDWRPKLSQH